MQAQSSSRYRSFSSAVSKRGNRGPPRLRRSPQRRRLPHIVAGKSHKDAAKQPHQGAECGRQHHTQALLRAQRRHGRRGKAHLAGGGRARQLQFRRLVLQGIERLERQVPVERQLVAAAEFGLALRLQLLDLPVQLIQSSNHKRLERAAVVELLENRIGNIQMDYRLRDQLTHL